jgi:PPM family protein phosphatase
VTEVTSSPAAGDWQVAFRTDPGRVRSNNEDVPLVDPDRGVYGVIDGVGGHQAGEVAAAIAGDVILQRLSRPLGTSAERVREAIAIANNEIFKRASESPDLHGMTCVVTLAIVNDGMLTIGHVGDTRLYKVRVGGIRKLTRDHSPIGEREDAAEISETEAMRHPRRNEVFRDVGSQYRDKDEDEYVDVIQEPLEKDAALLLCTDGLTDMVPSTSVERIIRRHAGNPEAIADALIAAANDAGGRDNVTVVYVEGPEFAGRMRREPANSVAAPAPRDSAEQTAPKAGGAVGRVVRAVVRSRSTWFALGAIAGVLGALGLMWRVGAIEGNARRVLTVDPAAAGPASSIAAMMLRARPGDEIRLEPGVYRERVVVADGVSLVARTSGTVTFGRAPGTAGEWVAIATTLGQGGGRISGIRIESTPELLVDVGVRVLGEGRTIDLAEFTGPMRSGIEIFPESRLTLHGCHFAINGTTLMLGERAQVTATANLLLRSGRVPNPPVVKEEGARISFKRNVFTGFGTEIVKGATASERQELAANNLLMPAAAAR